VGGFSDFFRTIFGDLGGAGGGGGGFSGVRFGGLGDLRGREGGGGGAGRGSGGEAGRAAARWGAAPGPPPGTSRPSSQTLRAGRRQRQGRAVRDVGGERLGEGARTPRGEDRRRRGDRLARAGGRRGSGRGGRRQPRRPVPQDLGAPRPALSAQGRRSPRRGASA